MAASGGGGRDQRCAEAGRPSAAPPYACCPVGTPLRSSGDPLYGAAGCPHADRGGAATARVCVGRAQTAAGGADRLSAHAHRGRGTPTTCPPLLLARPGGCTVLPGARVFADGCETLAAAIGPILVGSGRQHRRFVQPTAGAAFPGDLLAVTTIVFCGSSCWGVLIGALGPWATWRRWRHAMGHAGGRLAAHHPPKGHVPQPVLMACSMATRLLHLLAGGLCKQPLSVGLGYGG